MPKAVRGYCSGAIQGIIGQEDNGSFLVCSQEIQWLTPNGELIDKLDELGISMKVLF